MGYAMKMNYLSYLTRKSPPYVIETYGEYATLAMDRAFNDWTDSLCKDGVIHPEQYNNYVYVGKYS